MKNHNFADHCGALQCVAMHCGTLWNVAKHLWNVAECLRTIVVHCINVVKASGPNSALRCIAVHCGNIAEGLQTIVVLYGACGASSTPCGGVHHILSPHNSGMNE